MGRRTGCVYAEASAKITADISCTRHGCGTWRKQTIDLGLSAWRRHRRRRSLGRRQVPVRPKPGIFLVDSRDEFRRRLKKHNELGAQIDFGRQRAILLLLCLAHRQAKRARLRGIESLRDCFVQRHCLRIPNHHPCPSKGLDNIPLAPRGEEPRGEQGEEGESLTHGRALKNHLRKISRGGPWRTVNLKRWSHPGGFAAMEEYNGVVGRKP